MLAIQNISFFYGSRALYKDASLHIKPKDRIGLIGPNGMGKSTLLKIIIGELRPEEGSVSMPNDCTVGFLNQDLLSFQSRESILRVAMQGFARQLELQERIESLLKKMEENYEDKLVDQLAKAQSEFEMLEGYSIQSKAEEILEGLGFQTADLQRPLHEFSGGWRMRVMLAKLLLQNPSLLMLDEPTNHLDLPSIEWLENYLVQYEGAVIIVSHDRYFLDRAVNKIVEVSGGKLNLYSGNYTFFEEEKALRNEVQANAFRNQQQQIKQAEDFIDRFRSKATKARQVQSRIKQLEKLDMIDEVDDGVVTMNFKFRFNQQPGKIIAQLKGVSKSYGPLTILKNAFGTIERGDKIAFIGANGKGKSTLLRMLGHAEAFEGTLETGHNVIPAFYAQHQLESLNIENEILAELKQAGSERTEQELRVLLGSFLFGGDDVFKKIKVLSGGEKSRVALARTLISQANFLLLDEPTNHLDMNSVNILAQALQDYGGTYVVVSHDRHFISNIANKIWYIEDQELKEYPGTYEEYVYWRENVIAEKQAAQKAPKAAKQEKPAPVAQQHREISKEQSKRISQAKKKVQEAETQIQQLEEACKKDELLMADTATYEDPNKLAAVTARYERSKAELDHWTQAWEKAMEELEEAEK